MPIPAERSMFMNFNTYTQKSIEAVQTAQTIARTRRNPQI